MPHRLVNFVALLLLIYFTKKPFFCTINAKFVNNESFFYPDFKCELNLFMTCTEK